MTILIGALSIARYMGIREEQHLAGLSSVNLFIGMNNAGKSTILNLVSRHLPIRNAGHQRDAKVDLNRLELNLRAGNNPPNVGIGIPTALALNRVIGLMPHDLYRNPQKNLERVVSLLGAIQDNIWFKTDLPSVQGLKLQTPAGFLDLDPGLRQTISYLGDKVSNVSGGSEESRLERVLEVVAVKLSPALHLPPTSLIPALRRIGPAGEEFADLSGKGLIDRLAELQNPIHDKLSDRTVFANVNAFIQEVTGNADAQINVPHDRSHVYVEMNGLVLPLENLGTGIQQVIMIAAFCTVRSKEIICIEEPELHLHPTLQRKLIDYLRNKTDNQYFIATHSAAFIDTPGASIFHVRLVDGETVITSAKLDKERHDICGDLGHRASDIVQSNAIVWVEGPSDRIYIKHWIRAVAPELREGTHYSVMFYGGRLLSHVTADDETYDDLIKLRPLNRNLVIMIDSDRKAAQSKINSSKQRLIDEFAKDGGVAWVTAGREVENYIDHALLQSAVKQTHPELYANPANGGERYDHALHYTRAKPRKGKVAGGALLGDDADKVKVAHIVCSNPADLSILDLKKRVEAVVALIRRANA